jgi:hypothetical protein
MTTSSSALQRPWRRRFLAAAGALATLLVLALAAELVVRRCTAVPFLGNSANLFAPRRFGDSTGNAREAEAVSFGEPVFLDRDGFRVPRRGYVGPAGRALLLVGDSVAFGPGVPEPETLAGRLRASRPDWNVLNAAVIGHAVPDHLAVVRTVLAERDDVAAVWLVYCLNDLSTESATAIRAALAPETTAAPPPSGWVERLRSVPILARANELLRERSKLYLLVRNRLSDPPRLYFAADLALYTRPAEVVEAELAPLAELARLVAARGLPLLVVVAPYAYQLREPSPENLLPQRLVLAFLERHGIPALDARPALEPLGADAFLPYDPMHLSGEGFAALEAVLRARLAE